MAGNAGSSHSKAYPRARTPLRHLVQLFLGRQTDPICLRGRAFENPGGREAEADRPVSTRDPRAIACSRKSDRGTTHRRDSFTLNAPSCFEGRTTAGHGGLQGRAFVSRFDDQLRHSLSHLRSHHVEEERDDETSDESLDPAYTTGANHMNVDPHRNIVLVRFKRLNKGGAE